VRGVVDVNTEQLEETTTEDIIEVSLVTKGVPGHP
jgi:hypothetical protein